MHQFPPPPPPPPASWAESIGLSLVTFWLAETAWVIISNPALSATAALLCIPKSDNFSSICASHTHFSVFQNQMTFLLSALHIHTSPCSKIRWLFFHLRFTYLRVPKSGDFSTICASHTHFSVFQNQSTFLPSALHIHMCGWPSVFTLLWLLPMMPALHFTWEKALLAGLWFLGIKIRGHTLNRELLHPEVMAL